jgi:tRNA G10  N-methylase Trm11
MAQEDLKVQLLMDTEHLAIKATEEFIAENKNDYGWNIELFGKLIMEQFQKDMTSTTKIKTNSITTSVIYNWLIGLLTKDWMEDVFLKKMDGTNLVENVESSNTKMTTIKVKKDGLNQSVKFVLGKELVEISLEESKSTHPTVKPIDLMAYLVRLVTPKGGIVLDPFMGSGSTGKACVREGMNFIGIEREDEYMEIAKTRIEHEQKKNKHTLFFDI